MLYIVYVPYAFPFVLSSEKQGREERENSMGKETRRMSGQYLKVPIVTSIFDSSHNSFFPSRRHRHPHRLFRYRYYFFSCHDLRGHASTGFQSIDRSCILRTRQGRLFILGNRGQIVG